MKWIQKTIRLSPRRRGFHIITGDLLKELPEIRGIQTGLAHFFLLHTSASLTINENVSPDVRADMEAHFRRSAPDNAPYYQHTLEGQDDMPAHIKSSTLGCSLSIPIQNGALKLGTWQGIYLGEHRERASGRSLVATLMGEEK